ncbi:hypothetical protein GQE99_10280 [Maritimibacter sp. DP07]|uniref:Uncharacterized protein n=1 Tax=Maritimibacter harenae TaxID=2606218 RepID=A0A845M7D0_9RHOB|nr:hypothetical protein [Maritimibacter harenae]MZR13403.1 hypothetical protein [Maritimibacter harenae]
MQPKVALTTDTDARSNSSTRAAVYSTKGEFALPASQCSRTVVRGQVGRESRSGSPKTHLERGRDRVECIRSSLLDLNLAA